MTGVALQLKKHWTWIQPAERRGTGWEPEISFPRILEACRGAGSSGVENWGDIERVDVRPSKGLVKVVTRSRWEIQIDAKSGDVLQTAYRRSDLLESMHDGTWFHPGAKLWIFLPAGVLLVVLWLTGMHLFLRPILKRRASGE